MQRIVTFFTALTLIFLSQTLQAQTASTEFENNIESIAANFDFDNDWGFHSDQNDQLYYIDFENLKMNLSDIIVMNDSGETLLEEEVMDLPVNTIFEIDFSEFGKGKYQIELRSFTGLINKEIEIK